MKALVHIYCGDGKGKTTAAVGLAVRAAGRGVKVVIARFLKTDDSGEVEVLGKIPGIRLLPCTRQFGFTWTMDEARRQEAREYYTEQFHKAWAAACALAERPDGESPAEAAERFGAEHPAEAAQCPAPEPRAEAADPPGCVALLVLDEIMAAVSGGFVPEEKLLAALDAKPAALEVVLTGRNPSEALIRRADYVTEMRAVKHPYDHGTGARKGIEY